MDPKEDGGFASRKFIFCVVVAATIVIVGLLAGTVLTGIAAIITEIYGALLGVTTLYLGGNIASTHLIAKATATTTKSPGKPATDKKPPVQPELPEDQE